MYFVSLEFVLFFCTVFIIYHFAGSKKCQNIIIIISSCIFYGWWSWKLLFLMLGLSMVGYLFGLFTSKGINRHRIFTVATIILLLGCLCFFKYMDFLVQSADFLLKYIGPTKIEYRFNIVLPIAISFHTFQLIAYVIDVYQEKWEAEQDIIDFFAFSFFFPQLIAGPIERAKHLLSQFKKPRTITLGDFDMGLYLIVYGFFLKLIVAENAGLIVDSIFVPNQVSGYSVIFGTLLFGCQIYCDFMSYSIIAKGTAALLGIELVWNFNQPYWSVSPQEFWQRWHISLSQFLRDYLYIPLGGNRSGTCHTLVNLFITMALGGLWHGASWNFVLWGIWHGLVLAVHRIAFGGKAIQSTISRGVSRFFTLLSVFIGWYIFRVSSLAVMHSTMNSLSRMEWLPIHSLQMKAVACIVGILFLFEFFQRRRGEHLPFINTNPIIKRVLCGVYVFLSLSFITKTKYSFIYFAF